MMSQAPRSKCGDEFFRGYVSLAEQSRKSSDFDFAMHWNHAAFYTAPHDDVTTGLAKLYEPQTF